MQYQLHLTGYVGGYDFDRAYVDYILGQHEGKPVNVLIDSLGGSLATALSIASAFRNHGDVTVHFVGMKQKDDALAKLKADFDAKVKEAEDSKTALTTAKAD